MKKSAIVCLVLAFVLALSTFAMAEVLDTVTGTDVTGTDVTGTDVTNTDVLAYGDLNGDKKVDAKDALVILKASVKKVELTEAQLAVADAYQDGKLDAKDALYVLRFSVKKEASLPVIPSDSPAADGEGEVVTGTDVTNTDVTGTDA